MNDVLLTRRDLDGQRCHTPGCGCGGVLFLHPQCHPHRGVDVAYDEGVLTIRCHKCQQFVATIVVASSPAPVQ